MKERTRFPRSVYESGAEPDARFSLANERTFLAWIRTSLALVAAGIAVEALDIPLAGPLRPIAVALLLVLGAAAAAQAWFGWVRTERALRLGTPLPAATTAPWLAVGIGLAIVIFAVGMLV